MKKIMLFLLFTLTAMISFAQDDDPKEIKLTPSECELVSSNNDFAFNLFRMAHGEKSQVLSPLSITYVLSLLKNGVTGLSKEEINNVLGFANASDEEINVLCKKLVDGMNTLDNQTKVVSSNGIFVNYGYKVNDAFAEMADTYYNVVPETLDFFDPGTLDYINKWASDHTEEMIKQVLSKDEFNPLAASYLLNALYFKGEWTHHFDKSKTRPTDFDGGKATADMMFQESDFYYAKNELYQSVVLPYGNKSFQMIVFLPQKGKSIDDVLASLDGSNWLSNHYDAAHVKLSFPRFEATTDIRLNDIMASLGMPRVFAYDEITEFCDAALHIGLMKQASKIRVDEEGTEAAAVTVVETRKGMNEIVFEANRPFLYVISEQSTGSILFIGQYCGETTAHIGNASSTPYETEATYNLAGQRLMTIPEHGIYIKNGKKIIK